MKRVKRDWSGREMIDELENRPRCGNEEVYIRRDGKTLLCWKYKHEFLGDWVKEAER